jgi:hypothetical protein
MAVKDNVPHVFRNLEYRIQHKTAKAPSRRFAGSPTLVSCQLSALINSTNAAKVTMAWLHLLMMIKSLLGCLRVSRNL